jgi:hypothetical protein
VRVLGYDCVAATLAEPEKLLDAVRVAAAGETRVREEAGSLAAVTVARRETGA